MLVLVQPSQPSPALSHFLLPSLRRIARTSLIHSRITTRGFPQETTVQIGKIVCLFSGLFSPAEYNTEPALTDFLVNTSLPNVTFPLNRSFAGNIAVNRANHLNDTLFFWAFESENGSLTADASASDKPWAIWLNGGCVSIHCIPIPLEFASLTDFIWKALDHRACWVYWKKTDPC